MKYKQLQRANEELIQAIVFTRQYIGKERMPAVEGWSWYDALKKHAPDELNELLEQDARIERQKMCERDGCNCTMMAEITINDIKRIELESNPPQYQATPNDNETE